MATLFSPLHLLRICLFFFFTTIHLQTNAQSISGLVLNEENEPIPYANIFINELKTGTSTDEEGKYFITIPVAGEYEMIISSLGYTTTTIKVILQEENIQKNIWLTSSQTALDEIVVKASKKDPAYAIIKKVQENKKKYLTQIRSYRSKVYVKAGEVKNVKPKKRKRKRKVPSPQAEDENQMIPTEMNTNAPKPIPPAQMNLVEIELTLNYEYPKKYKEERSAYKTYGNARGLFIPRFDETDFNFYHNLVHLRGIAELPVISPISRMSILSYKYKLISSEMEDGQLVHKIKVTPRKSGNSTCKGFLYINDGLWNINRLDLTLSKGGLLLFDAFRLKQRYQQLEENIWIPDRIEFLYEAKENKRITYKGSTLIWYSDFEKDYIFPKKFFGNEIAVTTREAYQRDTAYWKALRPEPLTKEQQIMVFRADSVAAVRNSKAYQDSIQAKYNKVTFMDLFWDGVGFRNHEKKRRTYLGSIPSLIDFSLVGGFRLGPFVSHFRRWKNGMMLNTYANINVGLKNRDLQGSLGSWFFYNHKRLASVGFGVGRSFYSINSNDAYLNQLKTSNYILHDNIYLRHSFEILNGLYLATNFGFNKRYSITQYDIETLIDRVINDDDPPLDFEDYEAFITRFSLSFTPRQRYMSEPNRKIILGSKFPTFSLNYRKGWRDVLGSDIDFDYAELIIAHNLILGFFGNTKYHIRMGQYLNTKSLEIVDLKRFRQSDPIWYSEALEAFQSLDTAFATTKFFIEAHHIHHFNGALVNNIPLVKKTKVRVAAGAKALYVFESKFHHEEIFAGLERVFRLGARRRLRVGVYGILAKSSYDRADTAFKISFDIIDTWKRDWSF
ncbi:MAG: DUF5686 and carboxypeptidase regulatory-like domain-containing protein [Bacteroidota bacterium]